MSDDTERRMLMIATYTVVGIVCTAMLYLAIDVGG